MKTVRLHLRPTPEQAALLTATLAAVNAAASEAAAVGFREKEFNGFRLQKLVYRPLRDRFGLPAQWAVKAVAKAAAVFARDRRRCPVFKPGGAVPVDCRLFKLKPADDRKSGEVGITTATAGRIKLPFACGDYQAALLAHGWREAKLIREGPSWWLAVAVDVPAGPERPTTGVLGVDLGVRTLATLSDGTALGHDQYKTVVGRYARRRAALQAVGTKSAKRRLKKNGGREARFRKGVDHVVSSQIVSKAKALNHAIALEHLTGIRRRGRRVQKTVRHAFSSWSFARLRAFVTYKAIHAGVPVWAVEPAYTSQTCAACGHVAKTNRKGVRFRCKSCSRTANADHNAALNIAHRAAANRPMVATGSAPSAASPRL